MNKINTREKLIDYCLRKLGQEALEVNVTENQIEDRIDDAFQLYFDYHMDATETIYLKHVVTQEDVDNRYLLIDDSIIGITRIFPLNDVLTKNYMWDLRYQMRLNELWDFTSINMLNYTITMQHLSALEQMFVGEVPIRFQRHTNKVYLDLAWGSTQLPVGTTVILEGTKIIDPEVYRDVYNDRILKELCTAFIKQQWGTNLGLKFKGGISLPNGLVLNGEQLYNDATNDIRRLEGELQNRYELPCQFLVG